MNALLVSASSYMHAFYVQISLKYSNHMKQFFFHQIRITEVVLWEVCTLIPAIFITDQVHLFYFLIWCPSNHVFVSLNLPLLTFCGFHPTLYTGHSLKLLLLQKLFGYVFQKPLFNKQVVGIRIQINIHKNEFFGLVSK